MTRVAEVLVELTKKDLDAILLTSDANIRYVSGFTGSESYVLLSTKGSFFITDGRYTEQAENECPGFQVIEWKKGAHSVERVLAGLYRKHQLSRVGFEQDRLTCASHRKLNDGLSGVELVPTEGIVEGVG